MLNMKFQMLVDVLDDEHEVTFTYHDDTAYNSLNNAMSNEDIEEKYEVNYIPAVEFWDQI